MTARLPYHPPTITDTGDAVELTRSQMHIHAGILASIWQEAKAAVDPTVGALAAVAVLLSGFWTYSNVALLFALLVVLLLDVAVGAGVAYKRDTYSGSVLTTGFLGKLFRLAIVILAATMDLVLATAVPGESGHVLAAMTPVTKAAMAALIYGESISVLRLIRTSEGDLPALFVVMRALDRANLKGVDPPTDRHYDPPAIDLAREMQYDVDKEGDEVP